MSTIITQKDGYILRIKLARDFNLRIKKMIESRLHPDTTSLEIDLGNSRFIDSEAVIFMHSWLENGYTLRLINPPEVLGELLDILGLLNSWRLNPSFKTNSRFLNEYTYD